MSTATVLQNVFEKPLQTVQIARFLITAAQFKAMDSTGTTDIVLLPAPGSGYAWVIEEAEVLQYFVAGMLAYATGTGVLQLKYLSGFAVSVIQNGDLKTARPFYTRVGPGNTTLNLYPADIDARNGLGFNNASVVMNISTAVQFTAGTMPFIVTLRYRLVSLNTL